MPNRSMLQPGNHRPIYLWAGPGTIRMNRLKFMNAAIDEQVHIEAHAPSGVRRVVDETGCNWVYLTYNWGFPPEQEVEDWESFSSAAAAYHAAGAKVFAYIQTSNCVYAGSFQSQDWYALDRKGRRIHYYTGRYMTCWQHPTWITHLEHMVTGAVQRGADGIFFDNPWYGAQPVSVSGDWLGSTGCYCPRCRDKYLQDTGQPIPDRLQAGEAATDTYIRWRANQVTLTLAHLSGYAKNLSPDIPISANNFDAVMRPSLLIFGIDLKAMAAVQDIVMIEDYGLPRYDAKPHRRLANNALTIRTARALVQDTPISVDPYDHGIGFDSVFPARRYQQGLAEAAACGASMVIKGTEFVENGTFTLLTAPQYYETRKEIGLYHSWLDENAGLYQNRTNIAPVALRYPGDRLWQDWASMAPLFFGAAQALLAAGIPWKVVMPGDDLGSVRALLIFDDQPQWLEPQPDLLTIAVPKLPAWSELKHRRHLFNRILAGPTNTLIDWGYRAYFESRLARKLLDRAGAMRWFTDSQLYDIPSRALQSALLAALPGDLFPRVHAPVPVLVEWWQRDGQPELHLVNYAAQSQQVQVDFGAAHSRQLFSPDQPNLLLPAASSVQLQLDIYSVILTHPFDNPI
jgi:hypothetical protein